MVDGKQERLKGHLSGRFRFSRDGRHYAYAVAEGGVTGKSVIVVDGTVAHASKYSLGDPAFSPDGRLLAYSACEGKTSRVIVDDKEAEVFHGVRWLVYSPEGRRLAYVASSKNFETDRIVVDGLKWDEVRRIPEDPVFSPDGQRLACIAFEGGGEKPSRYFVILDGHKGAQFSYVRDLTFSADSKKIAYRVVKNKKEMVVVDGREGQEYDMVGPPHFSPDGRSVAFGALVGNELWWKVWNLR